ncbi:MAG: hypothetical protein HY328_19095, partial [Chloroflexi bacterium]|nr:hypothetical protein [Chloroflexota bacterium]
LLADNPSPSEEEIRRGIKGNLCRCTGYQNIVKATQIAAQQMSAASAAPTTVGVGVAVFPGVAASVSERQEG